MLPDPAKAPVEDHGLEREARLHRAGGTLLAGSSDHPFATCPPLAHRDPYELTRQPAGPLHRVVRGDPAQSGVQP